MKFTIEKTLLLENLLYVTKAISIKNIIPVLNGIKFDLTKEGLSLLASDSDLSIKAFIDKGKITNIESEGSIVIQSRYIIEIVRKMPSDYINFELFDNFKLKIYSENNTYNLNCLNYKEYPIINLEDSTSILKISGNLLKTIINQTVFAISTQELRPILTGANLKVNEDKLECVVTDSYRMAMKTISLTQKFDEKINIVIPGKNLMEFEKILNDDSDVEMHFFKNKIMFKYKNIVFKSNLLNGTYPNTSGLLPQEYEIVAKVNNQTYADAVDRVSLLTMGKEKYIIIMDLKDGQMQLKSTTSELGKVTENVSVDVDKSANLKISFSAKFMLDALRTIEDDEVLILLNNDVKPIVIKSLKDESLVHLILPVKTY